MKTRVSFFLLAILILTGCANAAGSKTTALPTVVLDSGSGTPQPHTSGNGGGVTASGVVVPAREAQLAAMLGGNVLAVDAAVGDTVKTGQVLVRLAGSENQQAAVAAAQLQLVSAQQAYDALFDNLETERAAAQMRLATANKVLNTEKKHRNWKNYRIGSQEQIDVAYADLVVAQDAVKRAEEGFSYYADAPADDPNRAAALSALAALRQARDKAQTNLNYLLSMPSTLDVAEADAKVATAQAEVDAAQKAVDALKDGPDPDDLALAKASLESAEKQLAAAQAALDNLKMKAPFDGTVARVDVDPGEWVMPGQTVLVLAALDTMRVETTDLSERDVPQVYVGQTVTVLVKALNKEVTGKVIEVSPLADTLGGDIVYQTTISLDSIPEGMRAGMSVDVTFLTGE